ncbi:hypothetical protein ACOMHN_006646 [Nucella lapillus]
MFCRICGPFALVQLLQGFTLLWCNLRPLLWFSFCRDSHYSGAICGPCSGSASAGIHTTLVQSAALALVQFLQGFTLLWCNLRPLLWFSFCRDSHYSGAICGPCSGSASAGIHTTLVQSAALALVQLLQGFTLLWCNLRPLLWFSFCRDSHYSGAICGPCSGSVSAGIHTTLVQSAALALVQLLQGFTLLWCNLRPLLWFSFCRDSHYSGAICGPCSGSVSAGIHTTLVQSAALALVQLLQGFTLLWCNLRPLLWFSFCRDSHYSGAICGPCSGSVSAGIHTTLVQSAALALVQFLQGFTLLWCNLRPLLWFSFCRDSHYSGAICGPCSGSVSAGIHTTLVQSAALALVQFLQGFTLLWCNLRPLLWFSFCRDSQYSGAICGPCSGSVSAGIHTTLVQSAALALVQFLQGFTLLWCNLRPLLWFSFCRDSHYSGAICGPCSGSASAGIHTTLVQSAALALVQLLQGFTLLWCNLRPLLWFSFCRDSHYSGAICGPCSGSVSAGIHTTLVQSAALALVQFLQGFTLLWCNLRPLLWFSFCRDSHYSGAICGPCSGSVVQLLQGFTLLWCNLRPLLWFSFCRDSHYSGAICGLALVQFLQGFALLWCNPRPLLWFSFCRDSQYSGAICGPCSGSVSAGIHTTLVQSAALALVQFLQGFTLLWCNLRPLLWFSFCRDSHYSGAICGPCSGSVSAGIHNTLVQSAALALVQFLQGFTLLWCNLRPLLWFSFCRDSHYSGAICGPCSGSVSAGIHTTLVQSAALALVQLLQGFTLLWCNLRPLLWFSFCRDSHYSGAICGPCSGSVSAGIHTTLVQSAALALVQLLQGFTLLWCNLRPLLWFSFCRDSHYSGAICGPCSGSVSAGIHTTLVQSAALALVQFLQGFTILWCNLRPLLWFSFCRDSHYSGAICGPCSGSVSAGIHTTLVQSAALALVQFLQGFTLLWCNLRPLLWFSFCRDSHYSGAICGPCSGSASAGIHTTLVQSAALALVQLLQGFTLLWCNLRPLLWFSFCRDSHYSGAICGPCSGSASAGIHTTLVPAWKINIRISLDFLAFFF